MNKRKTITPICIGFTLLTKPFSRKPDFIAYFHIKNYRIKFGK